MLSKGDCPLGELVVKLLLATVLVVGNVVAEVAEVVVTDELTVVEEVVAEAVARACPVTDIVKSILLSDPWTRLPDCKFLVSHMKVTALRVYCWGELNVRVNTAGSDPEFELGTIAQSAALLYWPPPSV